MNEVAVTLVESCGKEPVAMREMGVNWWVRFRGNPIKFSEIPPDLSLHTRNWTFYAMHAIYET